MAEPNGKRLTTFIASLLSAIGGAGVALIAAGMWVGTAKANLDAHTANPEIHQTVQQKEGVARMVVDREVKPILERMQAQLDRIERAVETHR